MNIGRKTALALLAYAAVTLPALALYNPSNTFVNSSALLLQQDRLNVITGNFSGYTGSEMAFGSYGWDTRWPGVAGAVDYDWVVQFPQARSISTFDIQYYGSTQAIAEDYQALVSNDGVNWTQVASVTGNTAIHPTAMTWSPVSAKYFKYHASKLPSDIWGYGLIVQKANIQGPGPVTFADAGYGLSVIQSNSNGALISSSNISNAANLINGDYYYQWGQSATVPVYADVLLNDLYPINSVGIATLGDNQRPKTIDVYLSPSASGNTDWVFAGTMANITNGYSWYPLSVYPSGMSARRIRFDVTATYNPGGPTYIEELYAYIPEPATMVLLGAGVLMVPRRRRT